MKFVRYDIKLTGLSSPDGSISVRGMAAVCRVVADNAVKAVRLHVEGVSVRGGRIPAWLETTTHLVVDGLKGGSTVLSVEAPMLGPVQGWLSDEMAASASTIDPDATALTLLGVVVEEADLSGRRSDRLDRGMLDGRAGFAELTRSGVSIQVASAGERAENFVVDDRLVRNVE